MPTTPETASTPDTSTAAVPGHPTGGTHPSAAFDRLTGSLGALPERHPLRAAGTMDAPLLQALTGRTPDRRPVWFMRQAGRSLPEYRSVGQGTAMLDACLDPAMAAEITLQPVRRHDVDAAIFFSDIVVPMRVAGVDVEIVPGRGPVLEHPVRTAADVAALPELADA
ncbi:uroporphyrinogen decarboxylase family protein, partial [Kocuria oceani]